MKTKIQTWIYRLMRNNLVHRMRANGATWSRINEVLRCLGQQQIIKVLHTDEGTQVKFGEAKSRDVVKKKHGRLQRVKEWLPPKVIDKKS